MEATVGSNHETCLKPVFVIEEKESGKIHRIKLKERKTKWKFFGRGE